MQFFQNRIDTYEKGEVCVFPGKISGPADRQNQFNQEAYKFKSTWVSGGQAPLLCPPGCTMKFSSEFSLFTGECLLDVGSTKEGSRMEGTLDFDSLD